ncbi:MAG TPA: ABC transporter substrate-binding protein [Candidatus Binatia bacterium]|jgi:putative ABC transport system substrate-binding protein|nr:ABC transporter substrate-binding protein [Candidatus Binatia bacterium]
MRQKVSIRLLTTLLLAIVSLADAQQSPPFRIGWISNDRGSGSSPMFEAFREGMREFGYVEGRNVMIEPHWGEGSNERLEQLAVELVRSNPRVIVTQGGPATYPVIRAGATVPIVFGFSGDPVEGKVVESFARPGRNLTGVSFLSLDLVGKRMELLKEVMPSLKRVAILANPQHPGEQGELHASQSAAKQLGLALEYFQLPITAKLDDTLPAVAKSRSEAIVVFPDAYMMRLSGRIAEFAVKNRTPAISGWAQFAEGGNLMTYGPNLRDSFKRLAYYVDRILKGAKPADLPVELPKKFELVINLKAAKQLGLTMSQSVLYRADKVIR